MSEAEETTTPAVEKNDSGETSSGGAKRFLVPAIVVVLAMAGGFLGQKLSSASGGGEAPTADGTEAQSLEDQPADPADGDGDEGEGFKYIDLEPITVNLNDQRLTRYIRAKLGLQILTEDFDEATLVVEEKMPEIRNQLNLYLMDLTPEQVRGRENLNRILRDIEDTLNNQLWPDDRPLIASVKCNDWTVQ